MTRSNSHHAFRLLANTLADHGYPTVRFDYPGTGNSLDIADDHWTRWLRSAQDAADWIKKLTGAQRLVFIGLRIGATVAAIIAARRGDVVATVLLAPVVRGRSYIRQLQIEAQSLPSAGGLVLHELDLSPTTLVRIAEVDLRALIPPPHQSLIVAQNQSKVIDDTVRSWTERGAKVTASTDFTGLETMLAHNEQGDGQPADFTRIMAWLRDAAPLDRLVNTVATHVLPSTLSSPEWTDTPLIYDRDLFGILCEPRSGSSRSLAVVIGSTGRDPHYGGGRFGTNLARRLAREGISSLRIDFAGFGDSRGHPGMETVPGSMFETDRLGDFQSAINVLQARGYTRFVAQGLCAGAYHALHAGLRDEKSRHCC